MNPCNCAMCNVDRFTPGRELEQPRDVLNIVAGGVAIAASVWVGFAVAWIVAEAVRHVGAGWVSLLVACSVGGLAALWSETAGKARR